VLALALGVGAWALVDSHGGCDSTVDLSVAVAPDIEPAIRDVANGFNSENHKTGERCIRVAVSAHESANVMNSLSDQGPITNRVEPDVWIPDSSQWVDQVQSSSGGAGRTRMTGTSVASSPIILAVPHSVAAKTSGHLSRVSWRSLLPSRSASGGPHFKVHMLDPTRSASGMSAMVTLKTMLGDDSKALTSFTGVIRQMQKNVAPDEKALFGSFTRASRGKRPALITSEHSVWSYNHAEPSEPATGVYPVEGSFNLDYPYVLTSDDSAKLTAARAFGKAVTTPEAKKTVQRLGFRAPDGSAGTAINRKSGLESRKPKAFTQATPGSVSGVLQAWNRLKLGTRMLTMLDISGSMNMKVPGSSMTRMQAMVRVAQEGLRLFPDNDQIGVWTFSTHLHGNRDWRKVVPLGTLSDKLDGGVTRREKIISELSSVTPKANGDTGLYDSILAGYRSLKNSYQPDKINSLMVFTDGRNEDDHGISLDKLVRTLHKEFDPQHPVSVFAIGFGSDIDPSALQKIAEVTNGEVYTTEDPAEIRQVFLKAVSRRICAPDCPE